MAVAAAVRALARVDCAAGDLGLILHCCVWHQGYDIWSAPHYIAANLGADHAVPVTLSQGCNAVMPAIELAAAWLATDRTCRSALITAADRYLTPGFDRWMGAYGCVYGDGGAAAVLRRGLVPGALAVRAISSRTVPELEEVNRAGLAPTTGPRMNGENVDLRMPKKTYFASRGARHFRKAATAAIRAVFEESLSEADVALHDGRIRAVAVPRMNGNVVSGTYGPALAGLTVAPVVAMQARTGHLSCADVLANAADLHAHWLCRPGDIGVILNVGGGYTWSSMVVEALQW
jgi:3-oxoacyl-[acyl-carrier-protein] synthase-3